MLFKLFNAVLERQTLYPCRSVQSVKSVSKNVDADPPHHQQSASNRRAHRLAPNKDLDAPPARARMMIDSYPA